jgi:hypothetical protein
MFVPSALVSASIVIIHYSKINYSLIPSDSNHPICQVIIYNIEVVRMVDNPSTGRER